MNESVGKALNWIYNNQGSSGGVLVHHKHKSAYPEVTGYTIPTLLNYGEKELAYEFLKWILCVQRANGGFTDPDAGRLYIFDSAQILRGLLAAKDLHPQALPAAKRTVDYLLSEMSEEGKKGYGIRYKGEIPETVHLYTLPQIFEAAKIFNEEKYEVYAKNCLEYYINHEDLLNINNLTHFLSYELEALIDLKREDLAIPVLEELKKLQKEDGSIRGQGDVEWVCSTGLAQIAICLYKIGDKRNADRAIEWLEKNQNPSGGFYGSYGEKASYFPEEEIGWATKFFLDAVFLQGSETAPKPAEKQELTLLTEKQWNDVLINEKTKEDILKRIKHNNVSEWAKEIFLNTGFGDKLLEAGSGTGEISLRLALSGRKVTLLDNSPDSLEHSKQLAEALNIEIDTVCADVTEKLPFKDNEFDCVWQSGLLEHFSFEERVAMLTEFARISKDKVISMVPNASCLAYRLGKAQQEKEGTWKYGIEIPINTLRDEYERAGLKVVKEYSVGVQHALNFLKQGSEERKLFEEMIKQIPTDDNYNQGYLLVTIGTKIL